MTVSFSVLLSLQLLIEWDLGEKEADMTIDINVVEGIYETMGNIQ